MNKSEINPLLCMLDNCANQIHHSLGFQRLLDEDLTSHCDMGVDRYLHIEGLAEKLRSDAVKANDALYHIAENIDHVLGGTHCYQTLSQEQRARVDAIDIEAPP